MNPLPNAQEHLHAVSIPSLAPAPSEPPLGDLGQSSKTSLAVPHRRALVVYATREGHTRRVAEHIAGGLRLHDVVVDLLDVRTPHVSVDWSLYDWVCVAASVHAGHHESEMIAFAKSHRDDLAHLRAAFVSVTLSEAGAEEAHNSTDTRQRAAADAQRMIDVFVRDSGWRPERTLPVAGALAYSKYNFLIRFVMKRIAKKAGAPTDTSRDYEFTDWVALDRFVMAAALASERTPEPEPLVR